MEENQGAATSDGKKVIFRPLHVNDRDEIKKLHESWFPVNYSDQFYDDSVQNKAITGDRLYSCVATVVGEEDEENVVNSSKAYGEEAWKDLESSFNVDFDIDS